MNYEETLKFDKYLKDEILKHYDIAVRLIWDNDDHRRIFSYLKSLTMYTRVKTFSHFGEQGTYFAFRFNERDDLLCSINKISRLIENEKMLFSKKEIIDGCNIFTLK